MKILGISAHYHDSAAALVVDGVPVCAVQEERLSRHKNDAAFPLGAIEWCLDHAGLEPADLDAVVFYERQHAEVRADPHLRAARLPALLAVVSHAMKNSLGEKVWVRGIISSHLGVPAREDPVHRAPPVPCGGRLPHRADAARGDPDRRRRGRVGHAHGRSRRAAPGRRHRTSRCCAKSDSPFARDAVFDVHRLSRLRGQRGRVQGHGARRLRAADDGRAGPQADSPHAGRRLRARPGLLRVPDDRQRDRIPRGSSSCSGRRATRTTRSTSRPPTAARFADCAASVQRVLEDTLVDMRASLHRETGLPDLCLGGGVALNGVANARILAESGFERVFVPPAPGDAGCALGAALYADRIHFGNPDRDVPDHPFWGPAVDGRTWRGRRARTARTSRSSDDAALIERVADAARRRPRRRVDGRRHRVRAARPGTPQHPGRAAFARDARPAQSRHQVSARSSGRSPRSCRSRRRIAISSCRRVARGWLASCRACSRSGRSGGRGSPRSRTSTARHGCRRSSATWRRGCTRCSRRTAGAPAFRSCSIPRSTFPASRSSRVRSRGIRLSGAAGSTCSSRARRW